MLENKQMLFDLLHHPDGFLYHIKRHEPGLHNGAYGMKLTEVKVHKLAHYEYDLWVSCLLFSFAN